MSVFMQLSDFGLGCVLTEKPTPSRRDWYDTCSAGEYFQSEFVKHYNHYGHDSKVLMLQSCICCVMRNNASPALILICGLTGAYVRHTLQICSTATLTCLSQIPLVAVLHKLPLGLIIRCLV